MQIPLEITFRDMDRSPAVEECIHQWTAKLESVYDRIVRCEVLVEAPHRHRRNGRAYHVRVRLTVPGGEVVVSRDTGSSEAHGDVFVAVRDSFRAARRQLEDHVHRHLRRDVKAREAPAHGRVSFLDAELEWGYLDTDDGRQVYFHRNSVLGGIESLEPGAEVRFAEEPGVNGPQASTVARIGAHGRHALGQSEASAPPAGLEHPANT
jgi:cold shock CspA family protein